MSIKLFSCWNESYGFGFAILETKRWYVNEYEFNRAIFGICRINGLWYIDIFWKIIQF